MKICFGIKLGSACTAVCALLFSLAAAAPCPAQQSSPTTPQQPAAPVQIFPPQQSAPPETQEPAPQESVPPIHHDSKPKPVTHITPEQAKQLFAMVDVLIKFSSEESGLPIKSTVKRQLTTRTAVESYLEEKFNEDEGAKRLERDEIVLKKFGMLDQDFALKPFLLQLLKEQIEAYYDSKTKTVNMLDWVDIDEQKPVLAHELTHALQDQHCDLEKWDNQTPDDVSHDAAGDQDHLAKDEMDTARDAVAEGQATAVMMDYILKPLGKSLVKDPEVLDFVRGQMASNEDSPVMARAPLLLSESMLFPYRDGLSFEQDIWMDQGQAAAFAGALDRPPTSSWEIINPREYEHRRIPAVPLLPDIHPLTDPLYAPYDIGQMGQLDVKILSELLGGDDSARDLTPAWDGGLYWAGQLHSAKTPEEQGSTKSLALFYLSIWKNADSAQVFAKLYANSLGRKYSNLKQVSDDSSKPSAQGGQNRQDGQDGSDEQLFSSSEGPVLITTRGKMVFVAESFPLPLARKLTSLILDAQGTGKVMTTTLQPPELQRPELVRPGESSGNSGVAPPFSAHSGGKGGEDAAGVDPTFPRPSAERVRNDSPYAPLTSDLVRLFENCGVMKAAVDAEIRAAR
jgi:hypothetical protein